MLFTLESKLFENVISKWNINAYFGHFQINTIETLLYIIIIVIIVIIIILIRKMAKVIKIIHFSIDPK